MADSAVAVTAGSGTSIDTRTEATNGHHRQVIVIGDPATNAGVAPVDATAGLKVDLGADNDITGTVTANLSATDNAVLDAIAADTTTIAGDTTSIDSKIPALGQALAAASVPVVLTAAQITTLTPPAAITGFATEAKQDTIIGHVDGIEGLLTTIDSDTGTIATEVAGLLTDTELRATPVPVSGTVAVTNSGITTIAGAVSGTEMQVDVLTMPTTAVTNAGITTIAGAVSGTEMQVDVLTMPTTTVTATDLDIRPLVNTDVVTAELSAVDNTVLDTIAAKDFATQTTLAAINAKLVTGTVIGDVNLGATDNAVLDTIATNTGNAATSLGTLDNAISGSEMQVDVVGALPAGTNAIGKLAANSGVDIGDVTLTAGTAAIGTILPPDIDVTTHTNYAKKYYTSTGAATDGIIWSPAAGKRWHVVSLIINTSAATTVTLEDDKAGGDEVVMKLDLAANSGIAYNFTEHYPLASGEDAADLLVTTSAGNIFITAVGYEI